MTRAELIAIHRAYRAEETAQAGLWPIRGRFNVAERVIRRLRDYRAQGCTAEEYRETLQAETSRVINDEKNW